MVPQEQAAEKQAQERQARYRLRSRLNRYRGYYRLRRLNGFRCCCWRKHRSRLDRFFCRSWRTGLFGLPLKLFSFKSLLFCPLSFSLGALRF
jgi:hypothetical protein